MPALCIVRPKCREHNHTPFSLRGGMSVAIWQGVQSHNPHFVLGLDSTMEMWTESMLFPGAWIWRSHSAHSVSMCSPNA